MEKALPRVTPPAAVEAPFKSPPRVPRSDPGSANTGAPEVPLPRQTALPDALAPLKAPPRMGAPSGPWQLHLTMGSRPPPDSVPAKAADPVKAPPTTGTYDVPIISKQPASPGAPGLQAPIASDAPSASPGTGHPPMRPTPLQPGSPARPTSHLPADDAAAPADFLDATEASAAEATAKAHSSGARWKSVAASAAAQPQEPADPAPPPSAEASASVYAPAPADGTGTPFRDSAPPAEESADPRPSIDGTAAPAERDRNDQEAWEAWRLYATMRNGIRTYIRRSRCAVPPLAIFKQQFGRTARLLTCKRRPAPAT